ncbi:MAG: hypothetical protein M3Z75_14305 [Actinomycetota bacterium]|nr:hypothetical protein [Actinomycetota bacterium]
MPDLNDDPLARDPKASQVTAGRTERQQAIAALITETIIKNGIDYGAGDSDVVAVHAETIDYRVITLHEQGLAITRKR